MTEPEDRRPFQLEPEAPPLPRTQAPEDTAETKAAASAAPTLAKIVSKDGEAHVVSTATVRERKDPSSRTRPGPLAPPPGWPREAFAYPVRDRIAFGVAVGTWTLLDLVGGLNAALGWVTVLVVLPFVARWQARAVARTASGADVAPAAADVDLDARDSDPRWGLADAVWSMEGLRSFGLLAAYFVPAAVPFLAPYLRNPAQPARTPSETAWMWTFVLVPLVVLAPAFLLAGAFDDRELRKPWVAARWFLRGPVAFLAVAASWVVVLLANLVPPWAAARGTGLVAIALLSVALRAACVYAVLLAARCLGVLGRRYEP